MVSEKPLFFLKVAESTSGDPTVQQVRFYHLSRALASGWLCQNVVGPFKRRGLVKVIGH